jgi:hypothetical protein
VGTDESGSWRAAPPVREPEGCGYARATPCRLTRALRGALGRGALLASSSVVRATVGACCYASAGWMPAARTSRAMPIRVGAPNLTMCLPAE